MICENVPEAQSIAKMDLTSPEVLRTTRAYRVFEHRALALRGMEKDLFYKSQRRGGCVMVSHGESG